MEIENKTEKFTATDQPSNLSPAVKRKTRTKRAPAKAKVLPAVMLAVQPPATAKRVRRTRKVSVKISDNPVDSNALLAAGLEISSKNAVSRSPKIIAVRKTERPEKSSHLINLKNSKVGQAPATPISRQPQSGAKKSPTLASQPTSPRFVPRGKSGLNVNLLEARALSPIRPVQPSDPFTFGANMASSQPSVATDEVEDVFALPLKAVPRREPVSFSANWARSLAIFVLSAIVLTIPLQGYTYFQQLQTSKGRVLVMTNEAIGSLFAAQKAATNLNLSLARSEFGRAEQSFALAGAEIDQLDWLVTQLLQFLPVSGKSVVAGRTLLAVGEQMAEVGRITSESVEGLFNSNGMEEYFNALVQLESDLAVTEEKFIAAVEQLQTVSAEDLPEDQQAAFRQTIEKVPEIGKGIHDLRTVVSALLKMLGDEQWQRYLLVFENTNELRATGGFMGTFGLLDIDRGQIKSLDIPGGGTYDLQGQLSKAVISPEPLHLINPRWEFQDSNWWPDFPSSARKMQWFYQNARPTSVDGTIVITSSLIERLLEIFGPIAMPEYGREVTADNFVLETQKIVELEYDKEENRPKQFLADLAPKLLERLFSATGQQAKELLAALQQGLNERQILLYFNDTALENVIDELGWSGAVRQTDGDYLMVVHTNIAGGKTDGVIHQVISHQAKISADGSVTDTVTLTRTHYGVKNADVFSGVQNNSYVRFYVPEGSELVGATGFQKPAAKLFEKPDDKLVPDDHLRLLETERQVDSKTGTDVYKESGKTVFGNWLQLKPGETQQATVQYRLPFRISDSTQTTPYYSLLVQKQAGARTSDFQSSVFLEGGHVVAAKFPTSLPSTDQQVTFIAPLATDQFYGVVVTNE